MTDGQSFFQARGSVESLKAWKISQLPLLSALSSELTVQRENLIYHLGDEWKGLVIWRLPSSKGKMTSSVCTDTASCSILDLVSNLLETFFFSIKITGNTV